VSLGSQRPGARLAPLGRDLTATVALALYSMAVGIGFARVFSGWDFVFDFAVLVVVGHGTSFLLRRARVSGWISIPVVTGCLLWVLSMYQYSSTLTLMVPGRATWSQVRLDVDVVREQFQTAVAPVIYEVGWATLAGLAMVIVIVMADSFAFKAEARGEALVPGAVLFVFIAALGSERMRLGATALLIATGVVAVVALRNLHDRSRQVELTASRGQPSLTLPAAVGVGLVIAFLAGVIGPRIPGAEAEPLYETRGRGGGITSVANPLVDIRSRLVNRGNVELFRVNADAEAYWRVTTLPEFDGRTFRLPNRELTRVDPADETLPAGRTIRQQIQVLALGDQMIPAAADPQQVAPNTIVRRNADTSTLIKTSDLEPGDQFTIVSVAPDVSLELLRATTTDNPPDEIFLGLPDDLPDVVAEQAAEVTAGAATDVDRMLALQDWFQTFEYSTEVQSGHGSNAIENFLQIRTGYCEQFAATFAAMARTLGVPSRVAVGYTSGRLRSDGWYSVLGKNSHAWPEVWFDGIGWVPFEPTPSRGIPGAEDYTGIAPQQDTSPAEAGGDNADEVAPLPATPTTVFRPPNTLAPPRDAIRDAEAAQPGQAPANPAAATTADSDDPTIPWWLIALALLVAAAALFPAAARQWSKRKARQHGTLERVTMAWKQACRAASRAGVHGTPAMTSREWAAATAHQLPVAARPMASLASVVDRVTFSPPEVIEGDGSAATYGRDCELWSAQVGRIATDTLSNRERLASYFTDWK
jgi:transglutaminase-like putative cysteine protease